MASTTTSPPRRLADTQVLLRPGDISQCASARRAACRLPMAPPKPAASAHAAALLPLVADYLVSLGLKRAAAAVRDEGKALLSGAKVWRLWLCCLLRSLARARASVLGG